MGEVNQGGYVHRWTHSLVCVSGLAVRPWAVCVPLMTLMLARKLSRRNDMSCVMNICGNELEINENVSKSMNIIK